MEKTKLYKLEWSIIDHLTGNEVRKGSGVYCGINLTDAQRDAVQDIEDFDDLTQVIVFDKNFYEFYDI